MEDPSSSFDLAVVKMPGKVPKWGRPKGCDLTVIRIPAKKRHRTPRPTAFITKSPAEKDALILEWVVKPSAVVAAVRGEKLIDGRELIHWQRMPTKFTDNDSVNLQCVRKFFLLQLGNVLNVV